LDAPPFEFTTERITLLYGVYVAGIFVGPAAGKISNRFGSGITLIGGSVLLGSSLALLLLPSIAAIVLALFGICTGFFTVHSAAVGSLNRRLSSGQGRANALYVLFYYLGGWLGITCSGLVFKQGGWQALIYFCASFLLIPLSIGNSERKSKHSKDYRNS
jgi:YNFM family putative membrane transporter